MDDVFRRRVEASVADALLGRIKGCEDADKALEDLERLRRFAAVDPGFNPRLVAALGALRDADYLDEATRAAVASDWKKLGGRPRKPPEAAADDGDKRRTAPRKTPLEIEVPAGVEGAEESPFLSGMLALPVSRYEAALAPPWNSVSGEDLAGFLEQINPIDGRHVVDTVTTRVDWRPLPFYEKCVLIRVVDGAWTTVGLAVFYLTLDGNLYRLNGTSPPIHEINSKAPIRLDEQNARDYLKFFTFFVRGDEGPFYLAESIEDPLLPRYDNEVAWTTVAEAVGPVELTGRNDQGHFLCSGAVYYSNAVFRANFEVQSTGMINMVNDEPVVGDLPGRLDAPIA